MADEDAIYLHALANHATPHIIQHGALRHLGDVLSSLIDLNRPLTIVTDDIVGSLYASNVREALLGGGWRVTDTVVFPNGESYKSQDTARSVIDQLVHLGVHRRSILVALGGGVVCDTVGYVAATYMRGIDYIIVPTSLMAQVDAGIGGKVAVNHPVAKNLIGAFHYPLAVVIDPDVLVTLPVDEIRSGLAEAVKVGIIGDSALFSLLESTGADILDVSRSAEPLHQVIRSSVRAKVNLLLPDPFEQDLRRALNLGHTFAHPLEVVRGYEMRHGFAVAVGTSIATRIAAKRGLLDDADCWRILSLLTVLGLPTVGPPVSAPSIWESAGMIRKVRGDNIHFVLPVGVGHTMIVDDLTFEEFLDACQLGAACEVAHAAIRSSDGEAFA